MKLYKFYAPWCNPCKMLTTVIEYTGNPHELVEVNIDENPELAEKFNVRALPTLVLENGGVEMERTTGPMTSIQFKDKFVTPYV